MRGSRSSYAVGGERRTSRSPGLARRREQRPHLLVAGLGEVLVVEPDGAEPLRREQAHHLVGDRAQPRADLRIGDGHRDDDRRRLAPRGSPRPPPASSSPSRARRRRRSRAAGQLGRRHSARGRSARGARARGARARRSPRATRRRAELARSAGCSAPARRRARSRRAPAPRGRVRRACARRTRRAARERPRHLAATGTPPRGSPRTTASLAPGVAAQPLAELPSGLGAIAKALRGDRHPGLSGIAVPGSTRRAGCRRACPITVHHQRNLPTLDSRALTNSYVSARDVARFPPRPPSSPRAASAGRAPHAPLPTDHPGRRRARLGRAGDRRSAPPSLKIGGSDSRPAPRRRRASSAHPNAPRRCRARTSTSRPRRKAAWPTRARRSASSGVPAGADPRALRRRVLQRPHAGRLRGYSQGDGASFVPAKPFARDEQRDVSARRSARGRRRGLLFSFHVDTPYPTAHVPQFPASPATPADSQSFVHDAGRARRR